MQLEEKTDFFDKTLTEYMNSLSLYARENLKIQTKEGSLIYLALNECQGLVHEILEDISMSGRLIRVYILKARREGVSTYVCGRYFWKVSLSPNRYALVVTHEPEATGFLFGIIKRFYDYLPKELKPQTKYSNQKLLEFNAPSGRGLDSAFRVGTAEKEDFGSAQLIHYLHLSEVSKWPGASQESLLTSLLQCVPDIEDTEIIFESTAKGIGGVFYNGFWNCRYQYEIYLGEGRKPQYRMKINPDADINNSYSSIFIPWFVFNEYTMSPPGDFTMTDEEKSLAVMHNLDDSQVYWRRWTIENKCGGDINIFKQEYPSNPHEAFLSSGRNVFDNSKIINLKSSAPKPIARYECQLSTGQFIANQEGRLLVWEEPKQGRAYVVSADVSEGLEKGDFSSADVIDQITGTQVAHWHGKIDPDQFALILVYIARRYNTAWIVPERNNHGIMVVTKISDLKYPRLYAEKIIEPPNRPRMRFGWVSTKSSKPAIVDNLIAEVRDNTHGIMCSDTFNEMLSFVQKEDGTLGSEEGMFDDRVMSVAIGKYVRTRLPLPSMRVNSPQSGGAYVSHDSPPPASAWT